MATKNACASDLQRDWTPVARGNRYCSPACGGGCTRMQFVMAQNSAQTLCTELGDGWKPRVWENLGWHYSATHGDRLEVYPHGPFTAYFSGELQIIKKGRTATSAVKNTLDAVKKLIRALQRQIGEVPELGRR